jgi:hypothetical protein
MGGDPGGYPGGIRGRFWIESVHKNSRNVNQTFRRLVRASQDSIRSWLTLSLPSGAVTSCEHNGLGDLKRLSSCKSFIILESLTGTHPRHRVDTEAERNTWEHCIESGSNANEIARINPETFQNQSDVTLDLNCYCMLCELVVKYQLTECTRKPTALHEHEHSPKIMNRITALKH